MSTQSQRSFKIRRADSNDGEAILACLAAAFAPHHNSYTTAGLADTVLDSESVQRRLREMHVFVAVAQGKVGGTVVSGARGWEGHFRGRGALPEWGREGVGRGCRPGSEA